MTQTSISAQTARIERGRELYATGAVEAHGDLFTVRSSGKRERYYTVNLERETCRCPDFELRREPCKHVYAASIFAAKNCRREKTAKPKTGTRHKNASKVGAGSVDVARLNALANRLNV